ncbi:MAG TPA: hypothetical protein VE422_12250 [Terriglobia bacterium]|nr:hypothetical protein [Terriglobia bacterium]
MSSRILWKHIALLIVMLAVLSSALVVRNAAAQQRGQGQAPPAEQAPRTPQASAPIDLTGWWVSIVTEDWRFRMVTPPKGDYASVPLNPEGRRVADTWDLAKDDASGNQCKPFGAASIMRVPGRLHITWQDPNTVKIETDAGTQTRLLHFGEGQPPGGEPTWQGYSAATWEGRPQRGGPGGAGRGGANLGPAAAPQGGSLKVVTTRMRPGYLRKNGVPYSENALMTEYFDRHSDYGSEWFTVTTIVNDPKYLTDEFITSTHFRKEPDGSKFSPGPCQTDRPVK